MRHWQQYGLLLVLFAWLFSANGYAGNVKPLQSEQAFNFSYEFVAPTTVIAKWKIAPGYYLYRNRFHFMTNPYTNVVVSYPTTNVKWDKATSRHEGYTGALTIPLTLKSHAADVTLRISYQGCAEQGFCYPPMLQTISLKETRASLRTLAKDQNEVNHLLATQNDSLLMLLFVGLGLLLSFTPCVLPMIPILTSIIVGQRGSVSTSKAFFLSLFYVLGTAITYSAAGVLAAMMGGSLQVWLQTPIFIILGAFIFFMLALSLFGLFDIHMPKFIRNRIVILSNKQRGGAYAGVFLMGVLSALLISPCVTAPLVGVLLYIGTTGDVLLGASALFSIGIGMGIPLIVIGVSAGKWLPKRGLWMKVVEKCFGVLMLAMAIWLLSRSTLFSTNSLNNENKAGVVSQFVVVHNQQQLNSVLLSASVQHKPVLLDFYADWCESCVTMEKNVFDKTRVRDQLKNFVLIRADLSDNSEEDQAMMTNYKVIAPPTVLLFNQSGEEDNDLRIIGEVNDTEFISRISVFAQAYCDQKTIC